MSVPETIVAFSLNAQAHRARIRYKQTTRGLISESGELTRENKTAGLAQERSYLADAGTIHEHRQHAVEVARRRSREEDVKT